MDKTGICFWPTNTSKGKSVFLENGRFVDSRYTGSHEGGVMFEVEMGTRKCTGAMEKEFLFYQTCRLVLMSFHRAGGAFYS